MSALEDAARAAARARPVRPSSWRCARPSRWPSSTVAEILIAADVHVATTLGRVAGVSDPEVLRCVALTVAAARAGPRVRRARARRRRADAGQHGACRRHRRLRSRPTRPLRLSGTRLYLDRYWREEQRLAAVAARPATACAQTSATSPCSARRSRRCSRGEEFARAAHRRRRRAAARPHRDRRRSRAPARRRPSRGSSR